MPSKRSGPHPSRGTSGDRQKGREREREMHGGSAYNSRSLDLHIARYPTVPSLEQYQNVDVQVGGRLFQQVPQKVRSDLWSNLTRKTYTGQDCIMRYPALQAQVRPARLGRGADAASTARCEQRH